MEQRRLLELELVFRQLEQELESPRRLELMLESLLRRGLVLVFLLRLGLVLEILRWLVQHQPELWLEFPRILELVHQLELLLERQFRRKHKHQQEQVLE